MSSSDEPTDLELLQRWRGGDKKAGDLLYRRHFSSLYSFCRGRLVGVREVDDMVQETFLRALRGADGFRGESAFRSFLFGIAKNVHREQLRKKRDLPIDASRESLAELSGRRYSSILGHKDEVRRLFDALQQIPLDDKDLLEQFHFHDLSVKDLAAQLELNENTLKSRLRLARSKLGRKYAELGGAAAGRETDDAQIVDWLEAARPDALRAELPKKK